VYEPFKKFDDFLYLPDSSQVRPVDLIEVHYERKYMLDQGWELPRDAFEWVKELKPMYLKKRVKKCLGAFVVCSIEPPENHRDRQRPYYVLHHRLLALIDQFEETPSDATPEEDGVESGRKVKRIPNPPRKELAMALGRVGIYPRLMMSGSAEKVTEILNMRSPVVRANRSSGQRKEGGYRMSGYYGCLRGEEKPPLPT